MIAAPAEEVWAALNDPEVLGACITGCQEITKIDDEHFDARVKAKIGPVSATFQAQLELTNLNPPSSYTIQGNVKGGPAGFGKGSADVKLEEAGDSTQLSYTVNANVGGKLAQVGSRLVDGAARKMADDFFAAFTARLSRPAGVNDEVDRNDGANRIKEERAEPHGEPASKQGIQRKYEKSGNGIIWGIAFVVLALAIILAI
jgi:carbon monoxide dehydrogenase subunit G